ncbi:Alpha/Beta hydrolase protein [Kockovaella imperatae]|uniref:Carboxylic ester hydrolase n=1 Tax=Kockovaella imperatae TaxID=4999 RepID=A0A1Y1UA98_9TREE|nr:Alpha/Beta hydrolase protein [Kockovaella imperatae]ORX34953.1 Alpha/Beta hydrolase protein [Kockovaella imperatae]
MLGLQSIFLACLRYLSLVANNAGVSEHHDDPVVHLPYGSYQGYYNASNDIEVWRSVRYAAPPLGANRWKPPQRPENETGAGVIDARDWPKQCPQATAGDYERQIGSYNPLQAIDDEDCLFLSVYKPRDAENLPVYVWFHGGGWAFNSAREFDGQPMVALSNNSIIHITVQYRLGIFGFLQSSQMGDGLNAGLKDALGSLQWVQEYIHLFGGDPHRVTIGGESAGAGFVYTMLAGEAGRERKLFHAAFASSGGGNGAECTSGLHKENWETVSMAAGCSDDLACLRNVSTTTLRVLNGLYGARGMCVEGPDGYVKQPVTPQLVAGNVAPVPVMAGNTFRDTYAGTPPFLQPSRDSSTFETDADALFLGHIIQRYPIDPKDDQTLKTLLELYKLEDFEKDNVWRISQCMQDNWVACSATYAADAAAANNVGGYKFLYAVPPGVHAQDNAQEYPYFYYRKEGSPDSASLFASFTGSLISLIKTGDPTSLADIRPSDDPAWPAWADRHQFKVFNVTSANISDAYIAGPGHRWEHRVGTKERCEFWAKLRSRDQW